MGSHLAEVNVGSNLFSPEELLKVCQGCLHQTSLKKLVIAFSDLGTDSSYIGEALCSLLAASASLQTLDIRCCNLRLADM